MVERRNDQVSEIAAAAAEVSAFDTLYGRSRVTLPPPASQPDPPPFPRPDEPEAPPSYDSMVPMLPR
jgi:hypothetical protein